MKKTWKLAAVGLLLGASAFGQEDPAASQPPADTQPAKPVWSEPEFDALGAMLSGSWQTTNKNADGTTSEVVMSVAPVTIEGVPNTLYAEVALKNAMHRPYRQSVWQLHRMKGKLRIKTLEFRALDGAFAPVAGLWAAPDKFSDVKPGQLVTTLDIELSKDGAGYKGTSVCSFPTSAGGASEMTSELAFSANSIRVADRGFDHDGALVWGPKAGEWYEFKKIESPVKVIRHADGLVCLEYPSTLTGEPAKDGKMVSVHYIGYLTDGFRFDSSYQRNTPFDYRYGAPLVPGWNISMADATAGQIRRIVIPSKLAYGEAGRTRGGIPPNATLIFDIEVLEIKDPPAPPQPPAQPAQPAQPPAQPAQPQ